MSSSLPTLDDLQTRARLPHGQTESRTAQTIPVVTPSAILQEQEARRSTSSDIFSKCTTIFQCSRFKSDVPTYEPLHRQMSTSATSSHPLASKILSPCRRWLDRRHAGVFIITFLITAALFLAAFFFWSSFLCSEKDSTRQNHTRQDHRWYRDGLFYEIFPASFQDTDKDGYGDFQGIIQRLDYICHLGMTAIRLNSIFSALDYPLEYEHIIDLTAPDPHLGRQGDFRRLLDEAHARGLKVVLELNPTITSDQYTWALHWQRGIPGYEHFYASANRSKAPPEMENSEGPPPEDWELTQRIFGGHYVLNWSNPFVQEEYRKALNHWIDLGVDGIYMKHLERMHVLSKGDMVSVIRQWRNILDQPPRSFDKHDHSFFDQQPPSNKCRNRNYETKLHGRRILIVSSKFADFLTEDFDSKTKQDVMRLVDVLDYPILVGSGEEMAEQVSGLKRMASWREGWPVPMWHLGSSDTFRVASRIEPRYQMAAFYLLMTLPGASSVFYGDEIGLKDSFDVVSGRVYRGGQLTPMLWTSDNSTTGGFTDNTTEPWLPPNPDYATTNVQRQQNRLQEFTRLVSYRRNTLHQYSQRGQRFDVLDPNVVVLERTHKSQKSKKVLLSANFGNVSEEKDFPEAYGRVRAVLTTAGTTRTRVRSRGFTVSPGAAFVAEVTLQHPPVVRRDWQI